MVAKHPKNSVPLPFLWVQPVYRPGKEESSTNTLESRYD